MEGEKEEAGEEEGVSRAGLCHQRGMVTRGASPPEGRRLKRCHPTAGAQRSEQRFWELPLH